MKRRATSLIDGGRWPALNVRVRRRDVMEAGSIGLLEARGDSRCWRVVSEAIVSAARPVGLGSGHLAKCSGTLIPSRSDAAL